jgi:poly(A) polymerase Pap1
MFQQAKKYYGITPPISTKEPEKEELNSTKDLIKVLAEFDQYETTEEQMKRQEVMGRLDVIFRVAFF